MNTHRFDTIARLFADRRSQRAAASGTASLSALAQDGTPPAVDPNDPHPSADDARAKPEFLFVQPFTDGTWAPREGEEGTYTLTLTSSGQTVAFSDRPERIVGLATVQEFLDSLGFTPDNPPNAALVTRNGDGQDVLVIELLNPAWDGTTLTYDARILENYDGTGLAHLAQQQVDDRFSASFGDGSLFIDTIECPDIDGQCYNIINGNVHPIGALAIGACSNLIYCPPCNEDGTSAFYGKRCAELYPSNCSFDGTPGGSGWDCFARGGGI